MNHTIKLTIKLTILINCIANGIHGYNLIRKKYLVTCLKLICFFQALFNPVLVWSLLSNVAVISIYNMSKTRLFWLQLPLGSLFNLAPISGQIQPSIDDHRPEWILIWPLYVWMSLVFEAFLKSSKNSVNLISTKKN